MSRKVDPVARAIEAYRAVPQDLKPAAAYLLRKEMNGEHLVVPPSKVGRPTGSRNRQKQAPFIDDPTAVADRESL